MYPFNLDKGNLWGILDSINSINNPFSIENILLDLLTAVTCLLAVWISLFLKPVRPEEKKKYWLFGTLFVVLYHHFSRYSLNLSYSSIELYYVVYNLRPIFRLTVLSIIEFFILRSKTDHKKRLISALAVQSVLTQIFSWIGGSLLSELLYEIFY